MEGDLTVAGRILNSKISIVLNCISCRSGGVLHRDSLAVKINGDISVYNNACVESDVTLKNDGVAVICVCNHIFKYVLTNVVNRACRAGARVC